MCVEIVCFPGCNVTHFEINLNFIIKPFFYTTKKQRQTFKYLKNEQNFEAEIKSFFLINFEDLLVAKSYLRPGSEALSLSTNCLNLLKSRIQTSEQHQFCRFNASTANFVLLCSWLKLISSQCSLLTPWKYQKTFGFLMSSGGPKDNIEKKWV